MQQVRGISLKKCIALFLALTILMSVIIVEQGNVVSAATVVKNTRRQVEDFGTLMEEATQFIVVKHKQLGGSHYAYTDGLSDETGSPEGNESVFHPGSEMVLVTLGVNSLGQVTRTEKALLSSSNGVIRDPDVSEDGTKVIFSWKKDSADDFHLYEMTIADGKYKQLTFGSGIADVEPKYAANGKIIFSSTRCISNVDCWLIAVMNLYTCDADGSNIMRLGYDQVHTTYPTTTEDGRVLYTRWDYNDRNQMYVQSVFQMFPDGSNQTEVYGNDSNFPTTLLHTRDVPGSTGVYVSISSGHHTKQAGKLVLVDTNVGRNDADAVTYLFPDEYCNKNENVDTQGQSGALYKYPVALNDHEFLVSYCADGWDNGGNVNTQFGIYYMNTETNVKICLSDPGSEYGASQVAMVKTKDLFERPSMVNQSVEYGTYYMGNVYEGGGLEGVEFGEAKYLRVVEIEYRPYAIGATIGRGTGTSDPYTPVSTGNGAWDIKRVLGIVEIEADGSALFRVPADTPIYFQVLNADGEMIQSMRSWSTLMPNETFSCVGCHEDKNTVPPFDSTTTLAMKKGVQELQPDLWMTKEDGSEYAEGEYDVEEDTDGFSYTEQIQPILDANCIACHNDAEMSYSMIGGTYTPSEDEERQPTIDADGIPVMKEGSNFKYTMTTQNGDAWKTADYSAISWGTGNAPFGDRTVGGNAPATTLNVYDQNADLYLRKDFDFSTEAYNSLAGYDVYLRIGYDDGAEIYLNGQQIYSVSGWVNSYRDVNITDRFVAAVRSGNNELAAYGKNTGGGMFLDFGIYLVPKAKITLLEKGSSFKYTTTRQRNNNWTTGGFNDSSWSTGNAPFGSDTIEGNRPNTNLSEANLYLRSAFTLTQAQYDLIKDGKFEVYMDISWDEDPSIYVNGISVLSKTGYTTSYQKIKITAAFLSAMQVGQNTLAASLVNTSGGQFLDFNIYLAPADPTMSGKAFSLEGIDVVGNREKMFYSLSYLVLTGSQAEGVQYVGNSTNDYTNWISAMSQCEMLNPYQFGSTQSNIIKLLKNGHGGTSLTEKEIQTIAAWIDLGVPYRGEYTDHANWGTNENREATEKQNKRDYYTALDEATKRISTGTVATDALPITVSYTNASGTVIKSATDNGMAMLYPEQKYTSGYKVTVTLPEGVEYFFFGLDARVGEALIYCPSGTYTYTIPSNMGNIFPFTFNSAAHPTISVRIATAEELAENRNLAVNPYDVSTNSASASAYPHANASTQYNSSEFAARNAIDGVSITEGHGTYPLQSWGATENDSNLWYQVNFGTEVYVDTVNIAVRSDWNGNHDPHFTSAVLEFSDGSTQSITLSRTSDVQSFAVDGGTKKTSYVKIKSIQATGGTWAAISEVEVYGSVNPSADIPMTGISIDKTLALETGESATMQITYLPASTTDDRTAEWTSSNPAVATVDGNGKIIALKAGTTTITAKVGKFTDTCTLTVTKPKTLTSLTVVSKPTKTSYYVGDTLNTSGLKLKATYSDGSTQTITSGFTVPATTFTSAGTKTITVAYGGKTTTFTVTVTAVAASSISITTKPTKLTYTVGESLSTSGMQLKVTYNNGTSKTVTSGWTVSPSGKLNTVGTQTVTVTYEGKSTTYTVTVKSAVPSDITSSVYTIDRTNKYVSKIKVGTTVNTFLNGINEKAYCKVFNSSGTQVSGSTVAATGMTIKLMDGSKVLKTYTLVVTGDVNGDGKINITDLVQVNAHILKKSTITGAKAKAADVNGDGKINITDLVQINAYILKKGTITAR